VAACLAACSWVQTLWPWRPEVAVTGPSDSGKSTLFQFIKRFFGRLSEFFDKPTEAAIRQLVTHMPDDPVESDAW
jgi:ABC-type uncharacterized transport system YnjBCD ATPase subunit